MSLAWSGLVLLVLLLPGVLFFVGAYLPEQFTRDAEQRSPLGQLAAVLLIAFATHGFLYASLTGLCGSDLPCIDVELLLHTINADAKAPTTISEAARTIRDTRWWIFSYVLFTCAVGVFLGWFYGRLVVTGKFQKLTKHPWVYDLSVNGLTYAYVMTQVQVDSRVLMYKGFLRAFGMQQDGRFSYIVLREVTRYYMHLEEDAPVTSASAAQRRVGHSPPDPALAADGTTVRAGSYFVIEGEDIANAVFDRLAHKAKPVPPQEFSKKVRKLAAELGITLNTAENRAIGG